MRSPPLNALVLILLPLLCFIFAGCSPMRFSQYNGRAIWPSTQGALAETAYAVPVYRDWPERPYDVIGSVRFVDPRKYWDDGIIRMAAATGKDHGGDAVIFRTGSVAPGSWLDSFTSRPTGYGQEQTALVIKWTPEDVLQTRRADRERFWANFKQKNPELAADRQLVQLATDYLMQAGVQPNSSEMETRLADLLKVIGNQPRENLSGKWFVRGTVQNQSLTASEKDTFFGVAQIAVTGNRVTIISTEGKIELNFSGTVENGQVTGTLGLGGPASALSVKCEGVALNEKISFAFQKLGDSGTVQGSVIFQR